VSAYPRLQRHEFRRARQARSLRRPRPAARRDGRPA
jgi:hypothetical protein